ncbi:hypothetical protein ACSSWA_14425, partial [Melioribacter sp. Ez-97]|uniref:hypothetical protein n=1 Tax=Melioribacter sp. Ez-97 TaxID=3423434 RepID=UPI003EDAF936
ERQRGLLSSLMLADSERLCPLPLRSLLFNLSLLRRSICSLLAKTKFCLEFVSPRILRVAKTSLYLKQENAGARH